MSDQERCPTCGSDKKEAQWCRICKAPYQDGGICVRSWLPKTHTFSHCSHPWHESAPSSGPYRVNCYVKGHEGGSQCKDCLAPSNPMSAPNKRFWMSWNEPTEDYRPLTFPPNQAIIGWWCSGYDHKGAATLCALVRANTIKAAEKAIVKDWPGVKDWRFINEAGRDFTLSDRFPLANWMRERYERT